VPILTVTDDLLRPAQVAQPESSAGEQLGALFDEMKWSGLFGARLRDEELHRAEGTYPLGYHPDPYDDARLQRSLTPLLTPEAARNKLRDAGLSESLSVPESGIRAATLDILIQRKRAEIRRQTILARPGANWPARLVGGLLGALVDPSNVALAFVPVVGEAKYAQLLAQQGSILGRTGVRLGVGAVEGTVGLLPGEAYNYYANVRQQADYDGYDFMLSIAGGAAFGSILHAGAGLFPEAMGRYRTKPAAAQPTPTPGVSQRLALDPAARERLMVLDRLADGLPVTKRQAEAVGPRTPAEVGAVIDTHLAELGRLAEARLAPEVIVALNKEAGELEALVRAQDSAAKQGVNLSPGQKLTRAERQVADQRRVEIKQTLEKHQQAVAAEKSRTELQRKLDRIDKDGDLQKLANDLSPRAEGERFVESLSPAIRRALETDPYMPARAVLARTQPETQALAFRMAAAQALRGNPVNVVPAMLADPAYRDIPGAIASARSGMDQVDGADYSPMDSAVLDAVKRAAKGDDIAAAREATELAEADVRESLASIGQKISDDEAEELSALMAQAKNNSEAAKIAALCMMRTGG
jgi:hypothetical protein